VKNTRRLATLANLLTLSPTSALNTLAQPTNDFPALLPPYAELPPTFWERQGLTLLLGTVASVLVAAAAVWLILRPKRIPVLPPEVQARRALEALRTQPEDGAWLSKVSGVLRRYVSAAFGLPASELTTRELIVAMESSQKLGANLREAIAEFLQRCDARKFAPDSNVQPQDTLGCALALVEQSEARRAELASAQTRPDA